MKPRLLIALALLSFTLVGKAATPETGMYYDPLRQGLGYYLEVQGDKLLLIAFAYGQDDGKPTFYYSSGTITHSHPRYSGSFDPPAELRNEDAYEYTGDLYEFEVGPCLTCEVTDWNTSEHASKAGITFIRFADENHAYFEFVLDDGTSIGSYMRRQGFGRPGYVIRYDGSVLDPKPTPFPSMLGEWVFTDEDPDAPDAVNGHYNFTEVEGPQSFEENIWGFPHVDAPIVRFKDPEAGAMLSCYYIGCALVKNGEIKAYIKFHDVGMDRVLGYVGDLLYEDDQDLYYRSTHLMTGVKISNPTPETDAGADRGGQ